MFPQAIGHPTNAAAGVSSLLRRMSIKPIPGRIFAPHANTHVKVDVIMTVDTWFGESIMANFSKGITLAIGLLLALSLSINTAGADGYPDTAPSLQDICHDLHVAFLAIASANESAPSIRRARLLDQLAIHSCQLNPRESIGKLQIALHLVTPR